MSNTRRAEPGTPLRQERWASSEEFERGLLGNLVARRCSGLGDREARQLVYFLQALSHREGGLEKVATDLLAAFPERIGTPSMHRFGMKAGQVYNASQVKAIRREIDTDQDPNREWPLRGERDLNLIAELYDGEVEPDTAPESYPAEEFTKVCRTAAGGLAGDLEAVCLNPAIKIQAGWPWYFPALHESLREYQSEFIQKERASPSLRVSIAIFV
jgi:hypothetical protein